MGLEIIKVCGITRIEEALHAAREGATALGFNFYPGSPRYVNFGLEAFGDVVCITPKYTHLNGPLRRGLTHYCNEGVVEASRFRRPAASRL